MSSTLIDPLEADSIASATQDVEAHPHLPIHRVWLVAVALVIAVTLGLTIGWQATTEESASATPPVASPATAAVPAVSVGGGLLALAWELTPPPQREAACAQFTANPGAAWAAYSSAAEGIATRAEFSTFFNSHC